MRRSNVVVQIVALIHADALMVLSIAVKRV